MSDEFSLSIDFTEIADMGPIPGGRYEASIVSAKPGLSGSGYPKIDVAWKIEDGEFESRQIFDTIAFHPNALPMTKRKLGNMGFPDDFSGVVDPEDLLGVSAVIVVTIEQSTQINPDTGEPYDPRNRVTKIIGGEMSLDAIL